VKLLLALALLPLAFLPSDVHTQGPLCLELLPILCDRSEPSPSPEPPRSSPPRADRDNDQPSTRQRQVDRGQAQVQNQPKATVKRAKKKAAKAEDPAIAILWCLARPLGGWVVQIVHETVCGPQSAVYAVVLKRTQDCVITSSLVVCTKEPSNRP